jgi:hypothetical protein
MVRLLLGAGPRSPGPGYDSDSQVQGQNGKSWEYSCDTNNVKILLDLAHERAIVEPFVLVARHFAHFKAHSHVCSIYLHEDVIRQVAYGVSEHHSAIEVRNVRRRFSMKLCA